MAALRRILAAARRPGRRHLIIGLSLALVAVLVTLLAGEILARAYHLHKHGIPLRAMMVARQDPVLGWEGVAAITSWPCEILVVGDSVTTPSAGLPEGDMYYSVLSRVLDIGVCAYGAGGYGTLQEYLVLERLLPTITPRLVILQTNNNDFINNSLELERRSYFNSNTAVRPYLVDGSIEYQLPSSLGRLRPLLLAHSRLFYETIVPVDRVFSYLAGRGVFRSVESDIQEQDLGFAPFRQAVATTELLVERIQARLGDVPLLVLLSDGPDEQVLSHHWRAILRRRGIPTVDGVDPLLAEAERRGIRVFGDDNAHWNSEGNRIVGEMLVGPVRESLRRPRRRGNAAARDRSRVGAP